MKDSEHPCKTPRYNALGETFFKILGRLRRETVIYLLARGFGEDLLELMLSQVRAQGSEPV
jgi:hypothetical protein